MKRVTRLLTSVVGLSLAAGMAGWFLAVPVAPSLSRPQLPANAQADARGAIEFEGASFGGLSMTALESHAIPWRLAAAALVMEELAQNPSAEISLETLDEVLSRFGFLTNSQPLNRPAGAMQPSNMPLGMNHAFISPVGGTKLLVANLGCAACHAGVTYDETGAPRPEQSWLGMPNTSLNLEAYVLAIFNAMRAHMGHADELVANARQIFPDMDWRETATLRWMVLPMVESRIEALGRVDRPLPFPNGVPGATNGVAALKYAFHIPLFDDGPADNGIVSIPELGSRVWRTSLLADGAYAPPGEDRQRAINREDIDGEHLRALASITTFFTVPSMGVHPDQANTYVEEAEAIFEFLANVYEPQAFPGEVNLAGARAGYEVYQSNCAACHGTYDWNDGQPNLTQFPNWLGDLGTDPLRTEAFTDDVADAIGETIYADTIAAVASGRYAAPPLTGIWASAPYLHNGSVPTIAALLSPEMRPDRFMLGGHALDFEQLGIRLADGGRYPSAYEPFADPVWYDTGVAGQSNTGHRNGEMLDPDAKRNLIEFLKLL